MSVIPAFAADEKAEEESLWTYADPTADIIVYVNTKQAEKAMEKKLWNRIQQDKNNAIDRNSEDRVFDTKGRDLELAANLRILSAEPFCCSVDGIANISGDMLGDIGKLTDMLKEDAGVATQKNKRNDMDFYSFSLPEMESFSNLDCMFVPVNPNQIQFRININSNDAAPQKVLSKAPGSSPAIRKMSSQELAFACVISPEKLAGIKVEDAEDFQAFLKETSSIAFFAYVAGKQMMINGSFSFKTESSAADFLKNVKPAITQIKSLAGSETNPKVVSAGKDVDIMIPVSVSDVWDMIMNVSSLTSQFEVDEIDADDEVVDKKTDGALSAEPKKTEAK